MEKKRHKIESNKFSKPPKTRSKNTKPIYLLFYKVWGRRERESTKFSKSSKTRRKKHQTHILFQSVDGEEERPKTE
jgi:hypothetical protein